MERITTDSNFIMVFLFGRSMGESERREMDDNEWNEYLWREWRAESSLRNANTDTYHGTIIVVRKEEGGRWWRWWSDERWVRRYEGEREIRKMEKDLTDLLLRDWGWSWLWRYLGRVHRTTIRQINVFRRYSSKTQVQLQTSPLKQVLTITTLIN